MLRNLYIKNFAIIEEINIHFDKGFTIITGETGAGKSILMGALSLVLGERADVGMLNRHKDKCIIEASFDIKDVTQARHYLLDNDFDADDQLIIRREIAANGKSRVFINDTPATLQVLIPFSALLLDLHRQFDTSELQQTGRQLEMLDDAAAHRSLLQEYQQAFTAWKRSEQQLQLLVQKNIQIKQELDYHTFTFQEIAALQLKENEIETAESALRMLEHAETFKLSMRSALVVLHDSDQPVISGIKQVMQILETQQKINSTIPPLIERLQSCWIEMKDIQAEIEEAYEKSNYDEEKIQALQERLNDANRLLKKHHVSSTAALLQIADEMQRRIGAAEHADEEEAMLRKETDLLQQRAVELAAALRMKRQKQIDPFSKAVNQLLRKVGMPNAVFAISISDTEMNMTGIDKVEFLFDSNHSGQLKPIAKVASGGELSRLMLCIKSMLAATVSLPTLIFDEIDTGISGETAIQVGNIMKQLSLRHQLISITHLPQIAGKAEQHLFIYKKKNKDGQMHTHLKKLNDEERIDVLAEMLSGKDSSGNARETVRELMK